MAALFINCKRLPTAIWFPSCSVISCPVLSCSLLSYSPVSFSSLFSAASVYIVFLCLWFLMTGMSNSVAGRLSFPSDLQLATVSDQLWFQRSVEGEPNSNKSKWANSTFFVGPYVSNYWHTSILPASQTCFWTSIRSEDGTQLPSAVDPRIRPGGCSLTQVLLLYILAFRDIL